MAGRLLVRRRAPRRLRSDQVLVLPTAAAYEHPERLVVKAGEWFASLGAQVEGLMVLSRPDAEDQGAAAVMREARFIYLAGSSPHAHPLGAEELEGVGAPCSTRGTTARSWPARRARRWHSPIRWSTPGAGGSPSGSACSTGLAVVPHFGDVHEDEHGEKLHRSVHLAPVGTPVAGIPERTALIREPGGRWSSAGAGEVAVFLDGARAEVGTGCPARLIPGPGVPAQSASVMVTDSMTPAPRACPSGSRPTRWPPPRRGP